MRTLVALAALCSLFTQATAQTVVELPADAQTLVVREALAIQSLARGGRSLIVTDPIEASIVRGTWSSPTEGQTIQSPDGRDATWQAISANGDGLFTGRPAAGYLHVIVRSPAERIMMLHARGHRHVFVNGQRRGGDVYNLGITALPILLQAGDNELLFRGGRGQIRIELKSPESDLVWLETDHTKPHAIRGKPEKLAFAVPIEIRCSARNVLTEAATDCEGRHQPGKPWRLDCINPYYEPATTSLTPCQQVEATASARSSAGDRE